MQAPVYPRDMTRRFLTTGAAFIAATAIAFSIPLLTHDSAAELKLARDNLKAVATGVLLYAQDSDDRLPSDGRELVTVAAYVRRFNEFLPFASDKPAIVYSGPNLANDGKEFSIKSAFVFNPRLYGVITKKIRRKSKTVLWSYGARNHLRFVFREKTVIAFADGSVRFVGRASVRTLRWKP